MRKKRITVLYSLCIAGMLAACGAGEEIQTVEKEDIAVSSPAQDAEEAPKQDREPPAVEAMPEKPDAPVESAPAEPAVVSIETDKKEYKDGDRVLLVTNYDDVTVSIEENEAAGQAVMAEFAKRKKGFEEGLELEETLEMARENPVVDGSVYYYEEYWYTLERNDGRILSFSAMWDIYEGGAHGQYMVYGVNFDAGTGKLLRAADIAKDKDAFREICVQEMLRQCESLKAQGVLFEEEMIAPGLREVLESKMEGDEWYFTENGIRFISNVYEIAPYAAGNIDFDIPYEMIEEELKEEYRK